MNPSRILVIKLRSLGDTVIMTAPLYQLVQLFPEAIIDVLVPEEWAPILNGFPRIQKIWTYHRHAQLSRRTYALSRLGYQLRKQEYDTVLNFHASSSSGVLAQATGAANKAIHFHGHRKKNHFSTLMIPGKGVLKPIIERDMDVIRSLGVPAPAGQVPQIFLQAPELRKAKETLNQMGMRAPILALSLGAGRKTKAWPTERYVSLAIEWCKHESGTVLALAGPTEKDIIDTFLRQLDDHLRASLESPLQRSKIRQRITATHVFSVRTLAAILSSVSVLAGNDSGPKHLAISVNTPTVTLFGPEHPFEWHPYTREQNPYFFVEDLPCRKDGDPGKPAWCGLTECIEEEHKCMQKIGVDSVLHACRQVAKRGLAPYA